MAPELFLGEPASEASDLYAVGVLAYQVLTCRHPFSIGDTPQQTIAQIMRTEPALTALPEALRPVIGRALRKAPSERACEAAAFSVELVQACGLTLPHEPSHVRDSFLIGAQFTGRAAELRTLRQALLATKVGLGTTWLIGGEAGVGKSRLIEELRSIALTEGLLVARGQAVKSDGSAYQVFADVLKLLVLHRELSELSLSVLGTLIPELSVLVAKEIRPPEVLDPQDARLRLLRVLDEMFERISFPMLILLEDLQWIDAESLGLLKRLTAVVRALPVLIIGTYRNDESPRLPTALPGAETLHLPRLSRHEMQQLCQSMLGTLGQDDKLLGLIERETEGNTYFIVEAVRQLATVSGSLMDIGRGELPERLPMLGIEQLVAGRLSRVPADMQPFLRFAAVAGRRLELAMLAESWQQLEQMLQACAEAGVLELHEEQWRFSHDKRREGLLERMSGEERARLHCHVAESLETVYVGSSMRAAQVAHHFHQAGELSRASHYYSQAGQSALTRGATVEAVSAFEQALALHRPGTASQIEQVKAWRGLSQALYGLAVLRHPPAEFV
jgi:predicted ATPase